MAYSIYEIVFGTLLHDIGKMIQRAYGSMKNIEWEAYEFEGMTRSEGIAEPPCGGVLRKKC